MKQAYYISSFHHTSYKSQVWIIRIINLKVSKLDIFIQPCSNSTQFLCKTMSGGSLLVSIKYNSLFVKVDIVF